MADKHYPKAEPEHEHHRRHRRRGGFVWRFFKLLLVVIVVLVGLLAINYFKEQAFDNDTTLTDTQVWSKLEELDDLVTYSYDYSNIREIKDTKQLFGYSVPGTTHTIRISYEGIIKVGFDVSEIKITVDNEAKKINISLPAPKVTDNYINMDTLSYAEQNNIFNPISGSEITDELTQIKADELKKAEDEGIYAKAESKAESVIGGLLSEFNEYDIVFED